MKTPAWNSSNDQPKSARIALAALLNQQLADALDLGLQAKQAHWNVKGPAFIALHELFDAVAAKISEFTDELAERTVALGGIEVAPGSWTGGKLNSKESKDVEEEKNVQCGI
jgi:starvation-inducible DNA-binding protein